MFSSFTCSFEAEQTDAPRPRRIHSNPLRLTLIAAAPNEPKVHIRFDPMLFDAMGGRAERTEAPVPRPAPNEPKARIRFNPAAFDAMKARAERTEARVWSRAERTKAPAQSGAERTEGSPPLRSDALRCEGSPRRTNRSPGRVRYRTNRRFHIRFDRLHFDVKEARAERTEAAGRSRRVRQAVPGRNAPSSLLAGCVRHPRPQRTVPSQTT
jgi:hypothetical protein